MHKINGIRLAKFLVFFVGFFRSPKISLTVQWVVTRAGNGTEPICITFQGEVILKIVYWAPKRKIPFGQVFHMGQVSPIVPDLPGCSGERILPGKSGCPVYRGQIP